MTSHVTRSIALLGVLVAAALWPAAPVAAQANAQAPVPAEAEPWRAGSGDAWVDARLEDINAYAERYPDSFIDEVSRYSGASRGYVAALLQQQRWQAGDIYMACFWAKAVALSCRDTVRARAQHRDGGWQDVVARLPVAPDNLHWRALRHAIVASHDRWDRPVVLDATLRRQLGDHAQRLRDAQAR